MSVVRISKQLAENINAWIANGNSDDEIVETFHKEIGVQMDILLTATQELRALAAVPVNAATLPKV